MTASALRRRRAVQAGVAALLVAPTVLLVAAGRSRADSPLGNYNGTVSSTAVHLQAGSSAFPNFATGAIDNHYPLATVHLDSSPTAEAFSSPLDTGPLGQTAAGAGHQNQPQYADVRCPSQCDKPVTVGSEPGPFSSSVASDTKAVATAQAGGAAAGGGAPAPPAPAPPKADAPVAGAAPAPDSSPAASPVDPETLLDTGRAATLRAALSAWRARYLTADDARRYPMPAADTPDGVAGDTARSESRLDGSTLVLDGMSAVGRVALGGGAVMLRDVSVHVTVTNDGTPKKTVSVDVASALVGGTPVTIGADGVSVNGQAVPGIGAAGGPASAALNQALGQAGIEIRSLAPSQQLTDHQLTLDAVGVLVRLAPKSPAPGVPAQFTAMAVGEVFADSLAVPGEGDELDNGLPGGDVGGGETGTVPATTPAASDAGTTAAPETASAYADSTAGGQPVTSDLGSSGSGSSSSSGSSAFGSSGSAGSSSGALGSGGTSAPSSPSAAPGSGQLAAPAVARRLLRPDKPTKLLLLYLLWQSLVIGTVASLYLWRKAAA
jgi:hypothetical protein